MTKWKIRLCGVLLLLAGGVLFVWSVRDITAEWPQIFFGLLSVFCVAMGFGILIMPLEQNENPHTPNDTPPE